MEIKQFYDKGLAQASYIVLNNNEIAIIDPARDAQPYYDFAQQHEAKIVAIIETHPHADFVSSHAEIARTTGAKIYTSKLVSADYPHEGFDDGDVLTIGEVQLKALNTPGHSPDSISVLLVDESGKDHALFSGDTLFIGDVGRPDLRESAGNMTTQREELARQMFQSTRNIIMPLNEKVKVFPAHGAGSLCGKNLSDDLDSTIGKELKENYALQPMNEEEFVKLLLEDQPFIPKYFGFDVDINKTGAPDLDAALQAVPRLLANTHLAPGALIVDTRPQEEFKKGHLPGSINIQEGGKFETWLGSIIGPDEKFYLVSADESQRESAIQKAAKIGYEQNISGALVAPATLEAKSPALQLEEVKAHQEHFTIVDVRNKAEAETPIFKNSLNIPLPELRERSGEIPAGKPVLVHCAGGYRSAAGSSILESKLKVPVIDLSEAVKDFD